MPGSGLAANAGGGAVQGLRRSDARRSASPAAGKRKGSAAAAGSAEQFRSSMMLLILPRENGGGGPPEAPPVSAGWWKGRLTRRSTVVEGETSMPAPLPPSSACCASSRRSPFPAFAGQEKKRADSRRLPRPGELRRAGFDAGFADHAISSRGFGEIKPPVGAFEQRVIVGGVVGAGGKADRDRD